ncbi:unnamed protein product [Oppiella nova]|uniref:Glycosyl hydrolase family 30 TIM-barrel domain-containing protein n=1 Tax=Oppiella nova TaxID=334625 RepID=A0A7R9QIH2_9ACAR|nr:unnamed protein product [Oppiella nova]CAG2166006.1 unnamed protein product [Oppiella nova]
MTANKLTLFGSPWSSPTWIKHEGPYSPLNGGPLIGQPGQQYFETWANYFISGRIQIQLNRLMGADRPK